MLDNLSPGGGPVPPYLNALSLLAGGSPNGAWNLFMFDDNAGGFVGFQISGWALTLEIEQPAGGGGGDTTAPDTQITAGAEEQVEEAQGELRVQLERARFDVRVQPRRRELQRLCLAARAQGGQGKARPRGPRPSTRPATLDPTPATRGWKVKKK